MAFQTHDISSLVQMRDIVRGSDTSVNLRFMIEENCSLNEARNLWKAVRQGPGGVGVLGNPSLLLGKAQAYEVIQRKLRQLERRVKNLTRVLSAIDASTAKLEQVIADGGPGVPAGFEPRVYKGTEAYVDFDEVLSAQIWGDFSSIGLKLGAIRTLLGRECNWGSDFVWYRMIASQLVEDKDLDAHIQEMEAMVLEVSPGSPNASEEQQLTEREVVEQRLIAEFNLDYLRIKRRGLAAERLELTSGLGELADRFLASPTRLGAGSTDFVRFVDHSTYAGELL